MRFRIDLKIFLFAILFYITKQIETYALLMIFALIHELGHLLMGIILGMKPNKFEIMPYGVSISFKVLPEDYKKRIIQGNPFEVKKILVALAGPIMNFIIIVISYNLSIGIFYKLMIIYANILLIIFNLLPIYPLDGGRIIKGILHIFFGGAKSERFTNGISFYSIIIITIISSILILYVKNISIFIIVTYLWYLYFKEYKIYKKRVEIKNLVKKVLK